MFDTCVVPKLNLIFACLLGDILVLFSLFFLRCNFLQIQLKIEHFLFDKVLLISFCKTGFLGFNILDYFHNFFVVNPNTHDGLAHVRSLCFFLKEFIKVVNRQYFFLYVFSLLKVGENLACLQFLGRITLFEFVQPHHLLCCQLIVFFVLDLLDNVQISLFSYIGIRYSVQ